jgi:hypothetical protein
MLDRIPIIGRRLSQPRQERQQPMVVNNPPANFQRKSMSGPIQTMEEKNLELLLCLNVPDRHDLPNRYFSLAGEPARHLQLTNIYSESVLDKISRWSTDLICVGSWDAEQYFDERQMKFMSYVASLKSVSYSGHPTERQSLNEQRLTQTQRVQYDAPPRESSSFLMGMMGGGR